jgi:tRNA-dihydrouridine synthase B
MRGFRLPPILHFAPLHGVTNRVFRKAYFNHFGGFDTVLAPFILSVNTTEFKKTHFKDLVPEDRAGIPLVPQILSNDAAGFLQTSKILADLGYGEVNWNLGCPYSMVANKKRGSGLLPFPDLVEKFLERVCAGLGLSLSIKLRLGRKDPEEILALMPIFNAYPLKKIIIHPRIGIQMYKGEVDLEGFARAAEMSKHDVVYNGDIRDLKTYEYLQARFPSVREWMIGRWAISDPFLPAAIRGAGPVPDRVRRIGAFHDELYAAYRGVLFGPAHVLDKMKEVWGLMGSSFPVNGKELERIARTHTLEGYESAVASIFRG